MSEPPPRPIPATPANTPLPPGAARVEQATGLEWSTIAAAFDAAGGASASHTELARAIEPLLTGHVENPRWWAQGATVAYEKAIGRRVEGQSSAGDFQVAVSRTLAGEPGELRSRTAAEVVAAEQIAGLSVGPAGRESDTPTRLYWRTGLLKGGGPVDATLEVAIEAKTAGRCRVTVTATKLVDDAQREAVRADLKAVLARVQTSL